MEAEEGGGGALGLVSGTGGGRAGRRPRTPVAMLLLLRPLLLRLRRERVLVLLEGCRGGCDTGVAGHEARLSVGPAEPRLVQLDRQQSLELPALVHHCLQHAGASRSGTTMDTSTGRAWVRSRGQGVTRPSNAPKHDSASTAAAAAGAAQPPGCMASAPASLRLARHTAV